MQYAATFKNNSNLPDFGKIAIVFADDEGLVPASGQFVAYLELIDPNGFYLASINTAVGTFLQSGSISFNLDIPKTTDDKRFIGGVYSFRFRVLDGVNEVGNKTQAFTYDPLVFAVSDTDRNNGVQVATAVVSCEKNEIAAKIVVDDTGFASVVKSISFLPSATVDTPSPVAVNYATDTATHSFVPEATFAVTLATTRTLSQVNNIGDISSILVQERLVNILPVKSTCDKWCALSECLLERLNAEDCENTTAKMAARIKFLEQAVYMLLADKCGNSEGLENLYTSISPLDCGCDCK